MIGNIMYDYISYNQFVNDYFLLLILLTYRSIYTMFLYLYILFQQDIKYRKMSFTIGFKNAFGIEILET